MDKAVLIPIPVRAALAVGKKIIKSRKEWEAEDYRTSHLLHLFCRGGKTGKTNWCRNCAYRAASLSLVFRPFDPKFVCNLPLGYGILRHFAFEKIRYFAVASYILQVFLQKFSVFWFRIPLRVPPLLILRLLHHAASEHAICEKETKTVRTARTS